MANSNNTLDSTSADVEKIEKLLADPKVLDFFANPTIDDEKKGNVLDKLAISSALLPHSTNFLNILVDAKRIDLIKDIVKEFETGYNNDGVKLQHVAQDKLQNGVVCEWL